MLELFQDEAENQTATITAGLLELERDPDAIHHLEGLMRAAHSLKGAARIMNLETVVSVAHAMEDCFVAAQQEKIILRRKEIDVLFQGVDLLLHVSQSSPEESARWQAANTGRIHNFLTTIAKFTAAGSPAESAADSDAAPAELTPPNSAKKKEGSDRTLRVAADNLNRLLGLAGESLVESRWLHPFSDSLVRLKRLQADMMQALDGLRESLHNGLPAERIEDQMEEAVKQAAECRRLLSDRLADLEMFDRRSANLSHRLYLEVLQCRMRPFGDGVRRLPRMVRDVARSLGKQAKLEIVGEHTRVDRDILDKLEAPLTHLLRNAVDHGCEPPEERRRAGKPEECAIRLEARHSAGMLVITVADDGAGIHPGNLRETVVQKQLATAGVAEKLSEPELLQFLLLPGFTMKNTVTEISGRGVGLDVVQNMVKSVRGNIRIATQPGKGMRFQLHLPLTLSVLRTLLVEIDGEPYAMPLSQINRTLSLPEERIQSLEGRHHFSLDGRQIGLVTARQVLGCPESRIHGAEIPVVVFGDRANRYGLVVDRFLGERELVVQALDPRLGKVQDITAASLMEDGSPVLIMDVEDMARSIEKLIASGHLENVRHDTNQVADKPAKRILAVDDSLTVRELQRKMLINHGYVADSAVDGMDGWNAVRAGKYDLVITDVDMPRMDGIELTRLIKNDAQLKSLPVVIISYKEREEDRLRGLEAGADYYLTKGGFHDETLLQAVMDLIGGPRD